MTDIINCSYFFSSSPPGWAQFCLQFYISVIILIEYPVSLRSTSDNRNKMGFELCFVYFMAPVHRHISKELKKGLCGSPKAGQSVLFGQFFKNKHEIFKCNHNVIYKWMIACKGQAKCVVSER